MPWQKCMPFSKCPNSEATNVINFKLCYQRDKRSKHKQNLENKAFYMGFMHLQIKIKEKFKLKKQNSLRHKSQN